MHLIKYEQAVEDGWANLQRSRAFVQKYHPYFYSTLTGLRPYHVDGLGTLGVNQRMTMGVDMAWFSTLDVDVGAGCLIHEVNHILRGLWRIHDLPDFKIARRAFDLPINDDLKRFGIKLPEWALYSTTFGFPPGLSGEKYYELLVQDSEMRGDDFFFRGQLFPGNIGSGNCGGCVDDHVDEWEKRLPDDSGRSPGEIDYFRRNGIQQLEEHCRKSGNVPGFIEEYHNFDPRDKALIPWERKMGHVVQLSMGSIRAGHTDFSLRRPSKRSLVMGIPRPGLVSRNVEVAFVRDSSGSMGSRQLSAVTVTFADLMAKMGISDVWFLDVDCDAKAAPLRVTASDLYSLPVLGRGGTDFRPAFAALERLRPRPDLVVYGTDGDGEAPETKPSGMEVVWLYAPSSYTKKACDWGIHILASNDPADHKRIKL